MSVKTVCVCAAQVPFFSGGAENLVSSLVRELRARGFAAELVQVPFKWYPREQILKSCLAWRLLDLTESNGRKIDLVIGTKFPSYVAKHPKKVTWLIHQFRQVYDQFGTPLSDFGDSPEDREMRAAVMRIDNATLAESARIYTISRNTAQRLGQFNNLNGEPLYHPPKLWGRYRCDDYGDYLFTASRLDAAKRLDLLIRAMARARTAARCLIAGAGPEELRLRRLIAELSLNERVQLLRYVDDEELLRLYAGCFAVAYVPFDEDYGYVTLEAFASRKPVVTVPDSGGVLEFVTDGETGYVAAGTPESLAARIDELFAKRERCARMGEAGYELVRNINWDDVIAKLTTV